MLKNLKLLREEAGITQKQLADAVAVSQQSINKYENHNIEPDIETLIRIADCFQTSVDYLIGHSPLRQLHQQTPELLLSAEEQLLLASFRGLTAKQKECVQLVVKSYREK